MRGPKARVVQQADAAHAVPDAIIMITAKRIPINAVRSSIFKLGECYPAVAIQVVPALQGSWQGVSIFS